jgi:hypothetical protein
LKPLPNELLALIIKIILTTNYQLLLNCNKVHRAHIVVSTCSLKNTGIISFERRICAVRILLASCCRRIDIDLYINFT